VNYTKPDVTVLGDAKSVIEIQGKGFNTDDAGQLVDPAYELDE